MSLSGTSPPRGATAWRSTRSSTETGEHQSKTDAKNAIFCIENRLSKWVAVISAKKPQAPIRNRQTRKVANAKGLNRNTNLA